MKAQLASPEPKDPFFGPVIYSYTCAQAIADGVLVDVSETAREVGFRWPVAITAAMHDRLTPAKTDQAAGQDYDARLPKAYSVGRALAGGFHRPALRARPVHHPVYRLAP